MEHKMETNEERVLAYNLAKEINPKDLGEVSGGGNNICMEPSGLLSGNSLNMDTKIDFKVDW